MLSADTHKQLGNDLFKEEKYLEAIREYTNAIIKSPSVSIYFTNRALCYLRLDEFEKARDDAKRAIELDSQSTKGYYFLGQALLGLNKPDDAFSVLKRALDMAIEQRVSFADKIAGFAMEAFRSKSYAIQQKTRRKHQQLYEQLKSTLDSEQMIEIDHLFKTDEIDYVPDYFCDPISFEIMMDPVIVKSGKSYDRHTITQHIRKLGPFDPLTREPLYEQDLVPNLCLRDAIAEFL
ncbi:E3 ubiquitin-protein ligase CHIP-like protein, partial [Gorgonomyces haynaldii]